VDGRRWKSGNPGLVNGRTRWDRDQLGGDPRACPAGVRLLKIPVVALGARRSTRTSPPFGSLRDHPRRRCPSHPATRVCSGRSASAAMASASSSRAVAVLGISRRASEPGTKSQVRRPRCEPARTNRNQLLASAGAERVSDRRGVGHDRGVARVPKSRAQVSARASRGPCRGRPRALACRHSDAGTRSRCLDARGPANPRRRVRLGGHQC
jgi:hypothetical protein